MRLKITVCKMIEIDSYKDGCDPDTTQDTGEIASFTCNKNELFQSIDANFCFERDKLTAFENRLEFAQLESDLGHEALPSEIEAWKRDEITLWAANYSIYVDEVRTKNINDIETYIKTIK